jgi:hypothetical protein
VEIKWGSASLAVVGPTRSHGVEVEMVASSPPQIHPLSTIARPSLGPRSVDGSAESCGSVKVHYRRIESKGSTVPLTMLGLEGIRGSKSAKHPPPVVVDGSRHQSVWGTASA